jgi:hypothetical protein
MFGYCLELPMDFSQRGGPPGLRSISGEVDDFHDSHVLKRHGQSGGGPIAKMFPSPHRSYNSYEDNEETSEIDDDEVEEDEDEIDVLSEEQELSPISRQSSRGIGGVNSSSGFEISRVQHNNENV